MQPQKSIKKPVLTSSSSNKIKDSEQDKKLKAQLFYRYRLPSLYRQLRMPIYENLLKMQQKPINQPKPVGKAAKSLNGEQSLQLIYKKVMLNSKYHHREKMRFSRTPLLKFLKYNFKQLQQKLKSKSYQKIYDDLEEEDEDSQKQQQKKQYPVDPYFNAEALARYKKKHNITGRIVSAYGYDDIKQRLIQKYHWTENEDTKSLMYDYKHMSKKKDIDYVNLLDEQVVNHFGENKSITAKFGLTRNIRNVCSIGKDPAEFFPRCFDVNDVLELENFYESFKQTYVQSLLVKCVHSDGRVPAQIDRQTYEKIISKCIYIIQSTQLLPIQKKISQILQSKPLYLAEQQFQWLKEHQKQLSSFTKLKQEQISGQLLQKAKSLNEECSKLDPQWNINKDNIWIVKPASLSRGRGIKTFNNIQEIFDYVIGKQISWVVQKYIENPLIIKKRKFDIRQWVLLTDFKPFRVWIYEECYIRFCATTYQPQNLKDRKIHLTNNSVTKGISQIKNDGISQNMLSQSQFSHLLDSLNEKKDIFSTVIVPQIQKISLTSLQSVKQNMQSRKSTFQIFGFDFMVDENYKVWLIQVNSSPTMQYSTKVTTNIVKKGMSDLGDLINNYMFGNKYYDHAKRKQLYGGWKLLSGF